MCFFCSFRIRSAFKSAGLISVVGRAIDYRQQILGSGRISGIRKIQYQESSTTRILASSLARGTDGNASLCYHVVQSASTDWKGSGTDFLILKRSRRVVVGAGWERSACGAGVGGGEAPSKAVTARSSARRRRTLAGSEG